MPSAALGDWLGDCAQRIDQLLEHHRLLGGDGSGRRRGLEQLNWAAVVRIAAEWQEFARKLHMEAVDFWVETVGQGFTQEFRDGLHRQATLNLRMDRGSADRSALQQDFSRVGINVLDVVKERGAHNGGRLDRLDELHHARHAIAHNDPAKLADVTPIHRSDVNRWRTAADHLADNFDACVGRELARLLGTSRPW